MTKLLDEAIAELRALPETEQDWAAASIRSIIRGRDQDDEYRLIVHGARRRPSAGD